MAKQPKTYPEEVQGASMFTEPEQALNTEPSAEELAVARQLTGSPQSLSVDSKCVQLLVRLGLAAETDEGLMRGFKWHSYFG